MKRILSLVAFLFVALLPFVVSADTGNLAQKCTTNDEGIKTCVISYNITDTNGVNQLTIKLTEVEGAEIISVTNAKNAEFLLSSEPVDNGDGTWTVLLASPESVKGEQDLFTLEYKPSDKEGCKISMNINGKNVDVTPDEPAKDTPEADKETGVTLPYVALGTIGVIAIGAYLATKNKSKMYKI